MDTDTITPNSTQETTSLIVTANAVAQVKTIMQRENATDHRLRIGVVGGGCSGMEYYVGLDADLNDDDEIFPQDGFDLVIDKQSLPYLQGASLDFATDFSNSGFVFNNPNATKSCGCGKSFCG